MNDDFTEKNAGQNSRVVKTVNSKKSRHTKGKRDYITQCRLPHP